MGLETRDKARAPISQSVSTRSSRALLTTNHINTSTNRTPNKLNVPNTQSQRSTRKSANVSKSVTPAKSAKSKTPMKAKKNSVSNRTFFTVREDATILAMMRQNPNDTYSSMATALEKRINHSSESIRDRIKRYLSKLTKRDEKTIIDANQVTFAPIPSLFCDKVGF